MMIGWLAIAVAVAGAGVTVTSPTSVVEVAGEPFHVIAGGRVLAASIDAPSERTHLVVDVARIGDPVGSYEGEAPIVVTIDGLATTVPNAPTLVPSRLAIGAPGLVSSYPVRFWLPVPRKRDVRVTVELADMGNGERAVVKLQVVDVAAGRAPLSTLDALGAREPRKGGAAPTLAAATSTFVDAGPDVDAGPHVDAGPVADAGETPAVAPAPVVPPAPARLVVATRDGADGLFLLRERRLHVDGRVILSESAYGADSLGRDATLFDALVAAGAHTIVVALVYSTPRGGVFTYVEQTSFALGESRVVDAPAGQVTRVELVVRKQGGVFTELLERPLLGAQVTVTPEPARAR